MYEWGYHDALLTPTLNPWQQAAYLGPLATSSSSRIIYLHPTVVPHYTTRPSMNRFNQIDVRIYRQNFMCLQDDFSSLRRHRERKYFIELSKIILNRILFQQRLIYSIFFLIDTSVPCKAVDILLEWPRFKGPRTWSHSMGKVTSITRTDLPVIAV